MGEFVEISSEAIEKAVKQIQQLQEVTYKVSDSLAQVYYSYE